MSWSADAFFSLRSDIVTANGNNRVRPPICANEGGYSIINSQPEDFVKSHGLEG
jgi:hypothetical protein